MTNESLQYLNGEADSSNFSFSKLPLMRLRSTGARSNAVVINARNRADRMLAHMDAGPEQSSSAEMSPAQPPLDTERILAADQTPLAEGHAVTPAMS